MYQETGKNKKHIFSPIEKNANTDKKNFWTSIDIVQDLYNEIEHLIDIPFESKTNSSPYEPIATAQHHQLDFHYKHHVEEEEEEQQQEITEGYDEEQQQQQHSQEQDHHNNNDYTFERPILIESDSDDIEEEYVQLDKLLP